MEAHVQADPLLVHVGEGLALEISIFGPQMSIA
jgi:hypothetical protein